MKNWKRDLRIAMLIILALALGETFLQEAIGRGLYGG